MPSPTFTFGIRSLIAVDQRVGDVADRDDHRDRHAALAGRAVAGRDGRVGGHVDVGVGQHDHVVLRPAERLAALAVRGRRLVDVLRDRRRADERDRRDVGMLEQRVDRDLVAVDDVEDAVGHAGLGEQLGREDRRGRVLLGRLEHERVAARERRRPHPHRDHRREVERRDPGDDAERLADRVDVDPGRGLLGEAALEQRRDPAAELDHLEPARDLAERVGGDLAVLEREQPREVLAVVVEELADAEEELGAARRARARARRGTPAFAACTARSTSSARREVDGARLHAGRGVVDRRPSARTAPRSGLPPIQWLIGLTGLAGGASTVSVISASSRRPRQPTAR